MGYYCGDYYTGDYYSGDPGFLTWAARIGRGLVGAIPGVGRVLESIIPTPVRKIAGTILPPVVSGVAGAAVESRLSRGRQPMPLPPMGVMPGGGRGPGAIVPGGLPGMRGYHMSKPRKCMGQIVPPHLVRNRRMRVTNPRALRRSIRRLHGFSRLAKKVLSFTHARPPKGRPYFKRKRTTRK